MRDLNGTIIVALWVRLESFFIIIERKKELFGILSAGCLFKVRLQVRLLIVLCRAVGFH